MPHIIVMHTLKTDVKPLLSSLHEALSAHETVSMAQVKTYDIPLANAIVGTDEHPENMIHIQVRMKAGRAPDLKSQIADSLHDAARGFVGAKTLVSSVSVEIYELDGPTYRSSYA